MCRVRVAGSRFRGSGFQVSLIRFPAEVSGWKAGGRSGVEAAVSCFGFRVPGIRFRVSGMLRVSGIRVRVGDSVTRFARKVAQEFGARDVIYEPGDIFGYQVSGIRFRVRGFGYQVSDIADREVAEVSGTRFQVSGIGFGCTVSGVGYKFSDFGNQGSSFGEKVPESSSRRIRIEASG